MGRLVLGPLTYKKTRLVCALKAYRHKCLDAVTGLGKRSGVTHSVGRQQSPLLSTSNSLYYSTRGKRELRHHGGMPPSTGIYGDLSLPIDLDMILELRSPGHHSSTKRTICVVCHSHQLTVQGRNTFGVSGGRVDETSVYRDSLMEDPWTKTGAKEFYS